MIILTVLLFLYLKQTKVIFWGIFVLTIHIVTYQPLALVCETIDSTISNEYVCFLSVSVAYFLNVPLKHHLNEQINNILGNN